MSIAVLAATLGIELLILSFDETTRAVLKPFGGLTIIDEASLNATLARLDFASAAVLVLHEHDKEPDILTELLRSSCYYIGALGNHAVHRDRLAALSLRRVCEADLRRIRAPVGSILGAKCKATFAIGVLSELMADAKAFNLIS